MDYVAILDHAEHVANMINQSEVIQTYEKAYVTLQEDEDAQRFIQKFNRFKERYEEVERFGRYHPDYTEIMQNIRKVKRDMDLHPTVAKFKIAEREAQRFLDEISEIIAESVSEHIIVPKEDGLFQENGCASGNCGSGGACSCNAS